MAELRLQPKKSAPSPWLLVGLAALLLAAAVYFFLRNDPPPPSDPVMATSIPVPTDMLQLADRADLRDDATIREQRDNFTSATARLTEGDPQASLRPGLVAAANLLRAVQQKAYPALSGQADDLLRQASQLSGRNATAADQTQNRQYLAQATALLQAMSQPAGEAI